MSATTITFDSYNLQTTADVDATILTKDIIYRNLPSKEINMRFDSIRDSFTILDTKYSEKIITISGWLIATDKGHLRTLIDNFKNALRPKEKSLVIGYGDSTLTYTGTVRSINIPETYHTITQLPFSAEFLCEPFGEATSSTTINLNSGNNIAVSPYNESISITGTYKTKPVITITIVSETTMTAIKFDNTTTGDWIQVARNFSAGEVLVIDCENETVKVDGTDVDFTGVFIGCDPATNNITITSTDGGAFTITVSIVYYPNYL